MGKRVLITGATGFIGCNMVSFLKKKGYFVRAVDLEVPTRIKTRGKMFGMADEVILADLRDYRQVDSVMKDIDWVFHFASDMGGVGYFTKHDYYPAWNNMMIDLNVLKASENNKVKRLFYSSSACVYPVHLQMDEGARMSLKESMIYPADSDLNYGWEKLMMLRLCEASPLDARVGILNTVYGEYQEIEGERMKFPTAITTKVLNAKGKAIPIWGNGKQIRQFLHISDFCEKAYLIMTKPYKGVVNITGESWLTIEDYAKLVCELVGVEPKFKFEKDKPTGVVTRLVSNDLFLKRYGYKEKMNFKKGFIKLIKYINENT